MKQQQSNPPQQVKESKPVEHPPNFYGINEVYSIRKETITSSNDQIYKRLSRQFQRIKKLKGEAGNGSVLSAQYDYESSNIRREFKWLHERYNLSSKSSAVVKKRIDKMRQKVDRVKIQIERDEFALVREIDLGKLVGKNGSGQTNSQSSQSVSNLAQPSAISKQKI